MPVYAGAICLHSIPDSNVQRVPPTGLDPGARVHSVKNLCISEVHSISVDPALGDVQLVVASDADGCNAFVVRADIEHLTGCGVTQPAAIIKGATVLPSWHVRVITEKV